MSAREQGRATALGFGLVYVLAGIALLLQEFGQLHLSWAFVLPIILTCVGLGVLLSGATGARRSTSSSTVATGAHAHHGTDAHPPVPLQTRIPE